MAAPFIPLTLGNACGPSSSTEGQSPFKVLTHSEAAHALGASSPASPGTAPQPQAPTAPPVVTVERDGDRVTHVRIQCSCGQVIELVCSY